MALYLARYLNVPPAALPGESGEGLEDLPATAEEIRAPPCSTPLTGSNRSERRHALLTLGHSPDTLIATLGQALLREDAGFHAYQILEAGMRQFHEWGTATRAAISLSPSHAIWLPTFPLSARCFRQRI